MSSEESRRTMIDLTQEPRKVFVNFLIFNLKLIQSQVFGDGSRMHAIASMRGLIKSLDEKSQKLLKKELQVLTEMHEGKGHTLMDLERVYQNVAVYLHKTYFKEAGIPHPKHPSQELGLPTK